MTGDTGVKFPELPAGRRWVASERCKVHPPECARPSVELYIGEHMYAGACGSDLQNALDRVCGITWGKCYRPDGELDRDRPTNEAGRDALT